VVQLDSPEATAETVRERCRFVLDIADHIKPVWDGYCVYQLARGTACAPAGNVELVVHDGSVRFAVKEGAWATGLSLHEAVEHIKNSAG
jgi:hypothetical protein